MRTIGRTEWIGRYERSTGRAANLKVVIFNKPFGYYFAFKLRLNVDSPIHVCDEHCLVYNESQVVLLESSNAKLWKGPREDAKLRSDIISCFE